MLENLFSMCCREMEMRRLDMASGEEVEGTVLAAVGRLKLIPQTKLPLILQLQTHNSLTQRAPVLTDHAQRGACKTSDRNDDDLNLLIGPQCA